MSTDYNETLNPQELEKFNKLAAKWWDPQGPFKPLHEMNPVRLNHINDFVDLQEKKVLDVGCGGGILSESMARRGAHVTGIDLAENVIEIAMNHASIEGLSIEYKRQSVEKMASEREGSYDLVTCLEMLEHVPKPEQIVASCARLVKPNGHVVFSTINRNAKSFFFAIIGAEYVLKLLPVGTHSYSSFIRPSELIDWVENSQLKVEDTSGLLYNPLSGAFKVSRDVSVNYILVTKKWSA